MLKDDTTIRGTVYDDGITWACRFHPTEWFHEVGCPHCEWTAADLWNALVNKKKFEAERAAKLATATAADPFAEFKAEAIALAEAVVKAHTTYDHYIDNPDVCGCEPCTRARAFLEKVNGGDVE